VAADCLRGAPDKVAVLEAVGDDLVPLTYAELGARSARLANHLTARGVRPGDRVAVKLSQGIDMAVAVLGILRAGAVVVPLSNVLAAAGLQHRLGDAGPRVVVAAGSDDERALLADLEIPLLATEPGGTVPGLHDVVSTGATTVAAPTPGLADEPALLLYTSGTTGKPKGVLQAQRFVLGHHAIDLALDHVRPDDIAYSPVDWTWGGGMMLGLLVPLAHGLTVVAHREPHFDPDQAVDLMARTGVSVGLMPPTVLRMFRASGAIERERHTTRLRCFITGAEAVEPELIEWGTAAGLSINNAYGQTEANALVGHAAVLGLLDQRSMGRPYPGHQIEVLDEDLQPVPGEERGQLAVRADDLACMLEYWNAPEATAAKVRDGWLLTGDTVNRAADGTLHFSGRNDDIIKSGAYRLGPAEIEGAVLRVPEVAECAVIGLPDPIRGQVVTAVVTLQPGTVPGEDLTEAIRRSVRQTVGAHAYPRRIQVVDHLPRTTTNKVDRASLRASLTEEQA
jgi:acetyl-CoA synthetase